MISLHLVYAAAQSVRLACPAPIRPGARIVVEIATAPRRAEAAPPVPLARGLAAPLPAGPAPRALAPTEATRGFSEGSFYLTGERLDRRA